VDVMGIFLLVYWFLFFVLGMVGSFIWFPLAIIAVLMVPAFAVGALVVFLVCVVHDVRTGEF
jgi:hypothetical protein